MNLHPLDDGHKQAWIRFFQAHGLITKAIDVRLRVAGMVPMDVYDVLYVLEGAPEGRLRMSELASRVLLTRSGMTRMTDRLEKAGLLRRASCPEDRRVQYVSITDLGLSERARAWEVYREGIAELFAAHVTDDEAATLSDSLGRIVDSLNAQQG